jgi:hypothetical protein
MKHRSACEHHQKQNAVAVAVSTCYSKAASGFFSCLGKWSLHIQGEKKWNTKKVSFYSLFLLTVHAESVPHFLVDFAHQREAQELMETEEQADCVWFVWHIPANLKKTGSFYLLINVTSCFLPFFRPHRFSFERILNFFSHLSVCMPETTWEQFFKCHTSRYVIYNNEWHFSPLTQFYYYWYWFIILLWLHVSTKYSNLQVNGIIKI